MIWSTGAAYGLSDPIRGMYRYIHQTKTADSWLGKNRSKLDRNGAMNPLTSQRNIQKSSDAQDTILTNSELLIFNISISASDAETYSS